MPYNTDAFFFLNEEGENFVEDSAKTAFLNNPIIKEKLRAIYNPFVHIDPSFNYFFQHYLKINRVTLINKLLVYLYLKITKKQDKLLSSIFLF